MPTHHRLLIMDSKSLYPQHNLEKPFTCLLVLQIPSRHRLLQNLSLLIRKSILNSSRALRLSISEALLIPPLENTSALVSSERCAFSHSGSLTLSLYP